ncbi:MAG: NAD-dependent epimerase/dehydratase family protein [Calditrichia bacterium]
MKRILVTGACGQIGSELAVYLGNRYGCENIILTDIKKAPANLLNKFPFYYLDVLNSSELNRLLVEQQIDTIFHMAAILSAVGEQNPLAAYQVNLTGLMNVLEAARTHRLQQVMVPSSIAVFGPDAPKERTPDETVLNPTTMYGVTKVAGEKLMQYYCVKHGVDGRSLRYPGIVSSETLPGGGTTDYAVDLYLKAVKGEPYRCYIEEKTYLPFMYMPDAVRAIVDLAEADGKKLSRQVYNVHAMSLSPNDIVQSIQTHYPKFSVSYQPDFRQQIAQSWPASLDDHMAVEDWNWQPEYDLAGMTTNMLKRIAR